jgi:hypothetical protein
MQSVSFILSGPIEGSFINTLTASTVIDEQKQGVGGECLQPGLMRLVVELATAQHLLSSFSNPFLGVKFLYDYGLSRKILASNLVCSISYVFCHAG